MHEWMNAWADTHWLRKLIPDLWPAYITTTSNKIGKTKLHGINRGFMHDYCDVSKNSWSNIPVPTGTLLLNDERARIPELGLPLPEKF